MRSFKKKIRKKYIHEDTKSYIFLIIMVPITAIAIVCLYYGIICAITGSLAILGAIPLILAGGTAVLALVFFLVPTYIYTRRYEKKEKR